MSHQPQTTRPRDKKPDEINPCLLSIVEAELLCIDETATDGSVNTKVGEQRFAKQHQRPYNHWLTHSPERLAFREQ